jgi:hypothetical protein
VRAAAERDGLPTMDAIELPARPGDDAGCFLLVATSRVRGRSGVRAARPIKDGGARCYLLVGCWSVGCVGVMWTRTGYTAGLGTLPSRLRE